MPNQSLVPKELVHAIQLRNEGKFKEALQVLRDIKDVAKLSIQDRSSCQIFTSTCLNRLGFHEDALKLAERTYQECEESGNRLQQFDASIEVAEASMFVGNIDKSLEIITRSEELLNIISQDPSIEHSRRESSIAFVKGFIYSYSGYSMEDNDINLGLKYYEKGLTLEQDFGNAQNISRFLTGIGTIYSKQGNRNRALELWKKALTLEKDGFNETITYLLYFSGGVYKARGEVEKAFNNYKQGLELAEEINSNKILISYFLQSMGGIYSIKGEFDHALEFLERGLVIYKEASQNLTDLVGFFSSLFHLALRKNDLEQAKNKLELIKQIKDQTGNRLVVALYRLDKALLLKTSLRVRNLAKAEILLKYVVEDQPPHSGIISDALLNLCDLLLIELRNTGDQEVIDELQSYINQLIDSSENNRNYYLLAETFLLQSKLALLTLDFQKSRRFLTQAQQIAERHDLHPIATKISHERDELLKNLKIYEKLKETDAPISERMQFIRLDKQIEGMLDEWTKLTAQIVEEKVTIQKETKICLVCRGEVSGFTFICKCDGIYCENCARALTDLENACWVCNAPIDKLKPVKPYRNDKEERFFKFTGKN